MFPQPERMGICFVLKPARDGMYLFCDFSGPLKNHPFFCTQEDSATSRQSGIKNSAQAAGCALRFNTRKMLPALLLNFLGLWPCWILFVPAANTKATCQGRISLPFEAHET